MNAHRAILWLLMLATVVAVQAGSGSAAQASCGDYLNGHGDQQPLPAHRTASPERPISQSLPYSRCPCEGPGCQKAPAGPTVPAPVKLSPPDTPRLGCLSTGLRLPPADQAQPEVDRSEMPLTGHLLSIEHPPRL